MVAKRKVAVITTLFAIVGAGADKARWAGTGNNPLAIVGVCHRALKISLAWVACLTRVLAAALKT